MIDPAAPVHRLVATEDCFAEGGHLTKRWNAPADAAVSVARARVEPGVTPNAVELTRFQDQHIELV